MARGEHHPRLEIADPEGLALGEQPVEIALGSEGAGQVVDLLPQRGDLAHLLADCHRRAQPLLQPGGGHQVVGMRVGVEDPLHLETVLPGEFENLLEALRARAVVFGSKFQTTSISAAFLVAGSAQMYWIEPVSGS